MTAYRWFKANKLPVQAYQSQTGTIIIQSSDKLVKENKNKTVFIYGRVSSYAKKDDLIRQVQRCGDFAAARGLSVTKVIKEVASGMNDKRPLLMGLFKQKPDVIIIEHKDRLTRFGFNYIETLLAQLGTEIIVINRDQEEKDRQEEGDQKEEGVTDGILGVTGCRGIQGKPERGVRPT